MSQFDTSQFSYIEDSLKELTKIAKKTKVAMDDVLKNLTDDKKAKINKFIKNNKSTDFNYIAKHVKKILDVDNNK